MKLKRFISYQFLLASTLFTLDASAILDNGAYFTPDGKKVVFHSYRDNAGELWKMNADGSHPKKLTEGNNHDRWPVVSGDGQKIAFISRRNGNWDVYTIDIDGQNLVQVTDTAEDELGASFSPNNQHIVFARASKSSNGEIDTIIANADGSAPHIIAKGGTWPLWNAENNKILFGKWGAESRGIYSFDVETKKESKLIGKENRPASSSWSLDGKHIYFVQGDLGKQRIYRMRADGSHVEPLNLNAQGDSRPVISPDGKLLIWGHNRHGDADLFAYDFPHNKEFNLTPNSKFERFPDVNLKTRSLLVSSKRDGNGEIYRIDHHKKPINLTNSKFDDMGARWSPDGKWFTYSSNEQGAHNVYIVDANGGHKRQMTSNDSDTFSSGWSFDGKYVLATFGGWGQQDTQVIEVKSGKVVFELNSEIAEFDPTFSPDGKSLVYVKGQGNDFGIYQINIHSKKETKLVDKKGWNFSPSFSPDGKKLAFSSNRDGDLEIFVLDLKTKKLNQLTDNYREDNFPRWTADGKALVFDSNRYGNFETYIVELDSKERSKLSVGH